MEGGKAIVLTEKKLQIWNEVVEKANSDYEGNKKSFWAFVGRTKGKKKGIVALRNTTGVSVTSTKGNWSRKLPPQPAGSTRVHAYKRGRKS